MDFPLWCVVPSSSSCGSTSSFFRPGDGARQYLPLVGVVRLASRLSALGRRPSACGRGLQYLHTCSFGCAQPVDGAASSSTPAASAALGLGMGPPVPPHL